MFGYSCCRTANNPSYTYLYDGSAAVVTNIAPPTVPTSGGAAVTITGTGTGLTGATGVIFGGTPGTNVTVNPAGTSIQVTAPARESAGATPVVLVFPPVRPGSLYVYSGLALIVVGGLLAFLTYRRRRRFAE